MEKKKNRLPFAGKIVSIIILCLTVILIAINLLIPLMGNSIADAHVQMMEANELFEEEPLDPMEFTVENMPNPAAHLGILNAIILCVQLLLMITLIIIHKKKEHQ